MSELYFDYIKERLGLETLVKEDKAFIVFKIEGEEIYIQDIYVRPDLRKTGIMQEMEVEVESLAAARGCTYATGTVQITANGSHESLKYCLDRGYKVIDLMQNVIILRKELANGN